MNEQIPMKDIDGLLLQTFIHAHKLSQKKNEINQQITACRADITERSTYIETVKQNIKKLEEEIRVKQCTLTHNKANATSMKATNNLLLQYEQTLREELVNTKVKFNQDTEVYNNQIESYWKIFQSHKEYYHQNPLAQKLLKMQADKEEMEGRIQAWDDQIAMKQKQLDHLTAELAVTLSPSEKVPDRVSDQHMSTEESDPQTEDDDESASGIASLHLNQMKNGHETVALEANAGELAEENGVQEEAAEEQSNEQQLEHSQPDESHPEEQESGPANQVLLATFGATHPDKPPAVSEGAETADEQASDPEDDEGPTQKRCPQSSAKTVEATPETPAFQFSFSPGSSHPSETTPAFLFAPNSNQSTPGFSDEESSFPFTSSFFNEKKATKSKLDSTDFLFSEAEQSEDFQFAFAPKSPQTADEQNTKDQFPFSFSF